MKHEIEGLLGVKVFRKEGYYAVEAFYRRDCELSPDPSAKKVNGLSGPEWLVTYRDEVPRNVRQMLKPNS